MTRVYEIEQPLKVGPSLQARLPTVAFFILDDSI